MNIYPKIQSIFKRDMAAKGRHKPLFMGDYTTPEFEYLKDNIWVFTEKIDGTNIRIIWDDQSSDRLLEIKGKTEKSQIPPHLLKKLTAMFPTELFEERYPGATLTLYGEGYGVKINSGGNYIKDDVSFILFDVKIGNWWLKREDVEKIAISLGIGVVPIVYKGSLFDGIQEVSCGLKSKFGDFFAEGVVGKLLIDLQTRSGKRIVVKIKHCDFYKT